MQRVGGGGPLVCKRSSPVDVVKVSCRHPSKMSLFPTLRGYVHTPCRSHLFLPPHPLAPPQLLVSAWDRPTSVDVLGHWLSMMHVHDTAAGGAAGTGCSGGWLPREQILGEEARRRVPAAFMAQVSLDALAR